MTPTSTRFYAMILGVSKSTVHRDVAKTARSVVVGLDGKSYPANADAAGEVSIGVRQAFEQGLGTAAVARKFGVSRRTVRRWHHRMYGASPVQFGTRDRGDAASADAFGTRDRGVDISPKGP